MAATIVHRGPDQQGVFDSPRVSLGATRLKIIDLSGGDQPISTENGDVVIVFNGEIYNHESCARNSNCVATNFDTNRYGNDPAWISRMGYRMFSRVAWNVCGGFVDASEKRLVLARDRMGIKPLYIARRGEDLLFGSELKTIFIHPELERRLSTRSARLLPRLNYVPSPLTMVEGIEQLPPGEYLEWREGKVRTEAYWKLPRAGATRTLQEAEGRARWLLQQSVREHLLSDVPLGMWLSGGIDSSTIVHYASRACREA